MNIRSDMTNVNYESGRYGYDVEYIVMHYTAGNGDTAAGNANYFRDVMRNASAHYFVDRSEVVQVVSENDTAWAVGDGGGAAGITNYNSISIEMCSVIVDGVYYIPEATQILAAELAADLLDRYGLGEGRLVRHYEASGKRCPEPFVRDENQWKRFRTMVFGGHEGYVVRAFAPCNAYVLRDCKLYVKPTTHSDVCIYAKEKDYVTVLDHGTEWVTVKYNDMVYFGECKNLGILFKPGDPATIVQDCDIYDDSFQNVIIHAYAGDQITMLDTGYIANYCKYNNTKGYIYSKYCQMGWIEKTNIEDEEQNKINFIKDLYMVLLGRPADEEGVQLWKKALDDGLTFDELYEGVAKSEEGLKHFIKEQYIHLLHREGTLGEVESWYRAIRNGATLTEVYEGFTGSDEYRRIS